MARPSKATRFESWYSGDRATSPPTGSTDAYRSDVAQLVRRLGEQVAERLAAGGGSREDALRGPIENLLEGAGRSQGLKIVPVGEYLMAEVGVRPDYAVDVSGARVGVLELKAPGTGVPDGDGWGRSEQERRQWNRLAALPNVVYSDGTQWALYRSGRRVMSARCRPHNLQAAGSKLAPDGPELADLLSSFFLWAPDAPASLAQLIESVARLCRVLRDEIVETLADEHALRRPRMFSGHLVDWRQWLFPNLSEAEFADSYAQTVTFGLLLARREGIDFEGLDTAAIGERLAKRHLLLGRALTVLTSRQHRLAVEDTSVVLQTLRRVISVVDWDVFADQAESAHLLYERFLEAYDSNLRQQSGSYYTPEPLTTFMVGFVDEVLRTHLGIEQGFADRGVVTVDPAMGTGSFLLAVVDRVARTVRDDNGDIPASLRQLVDRLIGFERQIGPFAVAELKLHHLLAFWGTEADDANLKLLVTDTLDGPAVELPLSAAMYKPLSEARAQANEIKSSVKVTVVIGNPPYRERAASLGGEIVARGLGRTTALDAFRPRNGRLAYKLHNLAVYFWRWATRKVFESTPTDTSGVIAFVTTSAYLTGPGFSGMREYLRRHADEGWIIDLSPEGHQPAVSTRVFAGVQHPICVGVFVRRRSSTADAGLERMAAVHHRAVSGTRGVKFDDLANVTPQGAGWRRCADQWDAPFIPAPGGVWLEYPALENLLPWRSPGIKSNRSWVWAPHQDALQQRWQRLVASPAAERGMLMKETEDRTVRQGRQHRGRMLPPLSEESPGSRIDMVGLAARSFDRQWIIDDPRVVDRSRPSLSAAHGDRQVYATVHGEAVRSGPAVVFTALVPDTHHTAGRGGVVVPLFRDPDHNPNIAPGLLDLLSREIENPVHAEDLLAYVAAVAAHPGYTARFVGELERPDLRIPLTTNQELWWRAVDLGRRVLWLHTYGERHVDGTAGRPLGLRGLDRPAVVRPIPTSPDGMPDRIAYDARTITLEVGLGRLAPVPVSAWNYDVSGMSVVRSWFDYRRRTPRGRRSSPLNDIVAERWTVADTEELRTLLALLAELRTLEPAQDRLLNDVVEGPLLSVAELSAAGVLPVPQSATRPFVTPRQTPLL